MGSLLASPLTLAVLVLQSGMILIFLEVAVVDFLFTDLPSSTCNAWSICGIKKK
jgi:hypothetical protein